MLEIEALDSKADAVGLNDVEWSERYRLETEMTFILKCEELYWQQRSRQQWLLEGDANTAFFHSAANGRRRRCRILALKVEGSVVMDPDLIRKHIYSFYKDLMGTKAGGGASLASNFWAHSQIEDSDNVCLTAPFTMAELEVAVRETKSDTAPGPDGIPVFFYQNFWPMVKQHLFMLLDSFGCFLKFSVCNNKTCFLVQRRTMREQPKFGPLGPVICVWPFSHQSVFTG